MLKDYLKQLPLTDIYASFLDKLTQQEKIWLAETKRFSECYAGDPKFREAILTYLDELEIVEEKYGFTIRLENVIPWLLQRFQTSQLPQALIDKYQYAASNPMLEKWLEYRSFLIDLRHAYRNLNDASHHNPQFYAWRNRQIRRCDDTLKMSADNITHPSFAFELSEGCSIGCWFCGISADKYKGYFPYDSENKLLWQNILKSLLATFGPGSLQTAFCYWATDPTDNPDYIQFIQDFFNIVGIIPQSTLARPVKDLNWTRALLEFNNKQPSIVNRFSITSLSQLKAVHKAFSAQELLQVELVQQHKQAQVALQKSNSGRARQNVNQQSAKQQDKPIKSQMGITDQHTTIACVTGFLINLCKRSIQLISPRPANDEFPLGYKVHQQCDFTDLDSFESAIQQLIDNHMSANIKQHQPLCFREDLAYSEDDNGFTLANHKHNYHIKFGDNAKLLGQLIHRNHQDSTQKIVKLATEKGANILVTTKNIDDLYQLSLITEKETSL